MKLKEAEISSIVKVVSIDAKGELRRRFFDLGIIEGTVISAVPMEEKQIKELEEKLSKKYNKNVTLENKVDKSVLGGVLVRLGNTEIDGTIKTRLNGLKNQLSQVI